ncbi:MAG: glutathione S-transferase family protein [Maricaulaceae bacterium]|jgi:glutathione S-transferase
MSDAPIKIYGDCVSGNCLKVRWVADQLGVPYEWVDVDILSGGTRTEEFLALNPAGQVPCIVFPDGRTLAQSNAIILYLAEWTGSDLIPEAAFERAKMMEWLFWEQYSHEPAIAVRRFQKLYLNKPEDEIDPQLMAKGRRALGRMEMALIDRDFLLGPKLSIADIALVAYTRVAHEGGFDLNEFPAVQAWVGRVELALGIPHASEAA